MSVYIQDEKKHCESAALAELDVCPSISAPSRSTCQDIATRYREDCPRGRTTWLVGNRTFGLLAIDDFFLYEADSEGAAGSSCSTLP